MSVKSSIDKQIEALKMKPTVYERNKAGAAFAMAAIYAARKLPVKLYRANGQWIVETY